MEHSDPMDIDGSSYDNIQQPSGQLKNSLKRKCEEPVITFPVVRRPTTPSTRTARTTLPRFHKSTYTSPNRIPATPKSTQPRINPINPQRHAPLSTVEVARTDEPLRRIGGMLTTVYTSALSTFIQAWNLRMPPWAHLFREKEIVAVETDHSGRKRRALDSESTAQYPGSSFGNRAFHTAPSRPLSGPFSKNTLDSATSRPALPYNPGYSSPMVSIPGAYPTSPEAEAETRVHQATTQSHNSTTQSHTSTTQSQTRDILGNTVKSTFRSLSRLPSILRYPSRSDSTMEDAPAEEEDSMRSKQMPKKEENSSRKGEQAAPRGHAQKHDSPMEDASSTNGRASSSESSHSSQSPSSRQDDDHRAHRSGKKAAEEEPPNPHNHQSYGPASAKPNDDDWVSRRPRQEDILEQMRLMKLERGRPRTDGPASQYMVKLKRTSQRLEQSGAEDGTRPTSAQVSEPSRPGLPSGRVDARFAAPHERRKERDERLDELIDRGRRAVAESPEQRQARLLLLSGPKTVSGIRAAKQKEKEQRLIEEAEAEAAAQLAKLRVKEEEAEKQRLKEEAEAKAKAEAEERKKPFIPALSPEWETKVSEAMSASDPEHPLVAGPDRNMLNRAHFGTLLPQPHTADDPSGWLNDEIVNAWFGWICDAKAAEQGWKKPASARKPCEKPPPHVAYGSHWLPTVREKGGVEGIARWSRRKNLQGAKLLLQVEKIFFPVNTGAHWTLLIISPRDRTIEYLDSMSSRPGTGKGFFKLARDWLAMELAADEGAYVAEEWTELRTVSSSQDNANDCGVFVCWNGLAVAKGLDVREVGARAMPDARRNVAAVLLNGGFSGEFAW